MKIDRLGEIGIVLDVDPYSLPPNAFSGGRNVRFTERGVQSAQGWNQVFGQAPIVPRWIKHFDTTEGPIWLYANDTSVYSVKEGIHRPITRLEGPYNATVDERWHSTILSGIAVLNNTYDVPQMWVSFSPDTPLQNLFHWPANLRCKTIRAWKNFLVAGNLTEDGSRLPFRIRWSQPALPGAVPDSWDPSDPTKDTGESDLTETSDEVIDFVSMGELNIIYREESTWAMQYIGPPYIFRIFPLLETNGLLWRDCAIAFPKGHFVVTRNDIVVHNGQRNSAQSLIHSRLKRWLFSQINPATYRNCFCTLNPDEKEIWFCFPEAPNQFATMALIWNWESGGIGFTELENVPFADYGSIRATAVQGDTWG